MMTIYVIVALVPVLTGVLLGLNAVLASTAPDGEKESTYECGYETVRGQTRAPFSISFYLVAVLFLAFDLEVATLIPLSASLPHVGIYGYWVAVIFFAMLTLGFVVEVGSGAITDQRGVSRSNADIAIDQL